MVRAGKPDNSRPFRSLVSSNTVLKHEHVFRTAEIEAEIVPVGSHLRNKVEDSFDRRDHATTVCRILSLQDLPFLGIE